MNGDDQELPDSHEIDAGWEGDKPDPSSSLDLDEGVDEEDAGSTHPFDARALLRGSPSTKPTQPRMHAVRMSSRPPPLSDDLWESDSSKSAMDERSTQPPPVPTTEYLARMMSDNPEAPDRESVEPETLERRGPMSSRQKPTLAERHRAILETLDKDEPNPYADSDSWRTQSPPSVRRSANLGLGGMSKDHLEDLRQYFDATGAPKKSNAGAGVPPQGTPPYLPVKPTAAKQAPPKLAPPRPVLPVSSAREIDLEDFSLEHFEEPVAPPVPRSAIDELDELPVDDMLLATVSGPLAADLERFDFAIEDEPTVERFLEPIPGELAPPAGGRLDSEPTVPNHLVEDRAGAGEEFEDESANERRTLAGVYANQKLEKIQNRFVVGDFSGALVLAEGVLEEEPDNDVARRYAESCRDMLRQMYLARIGEGSKVPRVVTAPGSIVGLTLDHRAGFVLACVDGTSSIDEILDVSGMPTLDALRIMYELAQEGIILIEDRSAMSRRR